MSCTATYRRRTSVSSSAISRIRLRNAQAVRDRLAALLHQANNVPDALSVERELERVAQEVDTLEGQIRYLSDRVAFSTITCVFQPRPQENLGQGQVFHLPIDWLDQLGLGNLLNLR